jgi:hypothetical protein
MKTRNKLLLILFIVNFSLTGFAQKFPATWMELEVSKQVIKNLKIELNPELRLLDSLKMDSYILEGGLSYKLHKYLTLASYYRYEDVYKYKKKSGAYKGQENFSLLAFDAKSGFDIDRFGIQFRLRYTQGIYANNNASEFRFRTKIDYDIKNCKLIPYVSVEVFHDYLVLSTDRELISGQFQGVDKIRYTFGTSYTINKNNEASIYYRLQDNRIKNTMSNILGLGYSFDF